HILQLIYVLLPISATFALWGLIRRDWAGLLRLMAVNVLGCAILLIFVLPIARSTFETAAYTEEGGFVRYSADLLSVVSPSFFNPLYAWLDYPRRVLGTNLEEGTSYIGIIAGALAIIGLLKFRPARLWLLLAAIAWVLSLGPLLKIFDAPLRLQTDGYATAITLPWAALQNLPLFNLARTPGRFNFALALAVAVLAGYGAAWVSDRLRDQRLRAGVMMALMVALLVDFQVYWPLPTQSAVIPAAVSALAAREDVRAVLDLPWENPVAAKDALYLQTAHHQPLVAGHVTRSTPVSPAKLTLLQDTLDPALLDAAGADVVILHKKYASDEQIAWTRTQLGDPAYEDANLAIFDVPDPTGSPSLTTRTTDSRAIERSADSYLYAPQTGWVDFSGTLSADGRVVELRRDQQVIQRWTVAGEQAFHIPIPVEAGAYHVIRLAVDPPCPVEQDPALECRAVTINDLAFGPLVAVDSAPVEFEHGLRLERGSVPASAAPGESLAVRLWWILNATRSDTDIRFVHLVAADGQVVTQDDRTLGAQAAGSQWAEQVMLQLPDDLPAGDYRVFTGWYTYPDFTRFAVESPVEGAANDLALIGHVHVP
ncbi:MAG: DUF4832 domain-containing protein, partial [Anaerolineae bacterium]|nr:DUF4832 domain-containing protein [Anaerolineae bacterium]